MDVMLLDDREMCGCGVWCSGCCNVVVPTYLCIRRAIKEIVVIITFTNYVYNFAQHTAVKVSLIFEGIYWVLSMWIWKQIVKY